MKKQARDQSVSYFFIEVDFKIRSSNFYIFLNYLFQLIKVKNHFNKKIDHHYLLKINLAIILRKSEYRLIIFH
jgi:hypothetical protein